MGKGTTSFGKRSSGKTHIICRRCGRHSYHIRDKKCSACGFGISSKIKVYSWKNKKVNKKRII